MNTVDRCIIDALNYFNLNSTEEAKYLPIEKKVEIFNFLRKQFFYYVLNNLSTR